ncbi:NTPase [Atlantic halibut reovirus]|nr:NTPase [Atlantic halibut reovirus]
MITIVFIPSHGFSWNEPTFLNYIDTRLYNQRISKERLTIFAPPWFKSQLENYVGTHGIESVFSWCQYLSSPLINRFVLLPRPKSFGKWLLSTPSANVWKIPMWKLKLAADGKAPPCLYDDVTPLLDPAASVLKAVQLIASNPIVYSRTQHVFGGPVYLATSSDAYSGFLSPTVLTNIFKHNADVPVTKRSELHLTILPNLTSPNAFFLDIPNPTLDPNYPLSAFNGHLHQYAANKIKNFPLDGLAWRLIKSTPKPEWTPMFDDAFKALRLSRPHSQSDLPNFGVNCELLHLECKLTVDTRDNPAPRRPLKVTLLNVPAKLLPLIGLEVPHLYPLRDEIGLVNQWFLVLVLMCDGIVLTGTRRPVMLQTAHAELQPWWEVELLAIQNPHMSQVRDGDIRDVMGVGVTLPKGSYKSTFIDTISDLIHSDIPIFPRETVTDSDDLGDSLSPSFEESIFEEWRQLGEETLEMGVRAILAPCTNAYPFPIIIYQKFSDMYHARMLPAQRERSNIVARRGRSLAYAHNPYEFISANVPIQVVVCEISLDSMANLLSRPNRVGGVTGQILLNHCYQLFGATITPRPVGNVYKTLFGPWLEYMASPVPTTPILLMTEVSAHSLRTAGWTIDGDEPLRASITPALIPTTSTLLRKFPLPTASRASLICSSDGKLYATLSPPLPVKLISNEILLPVTSVIEWLEPNRVILVGTSVSLKGPVTWNTLRSPSDVVQPGLVG